MQSTFFVAVLLCLGVVLADPCLHSPAEIFSTAYRFEIQRNLVNGQFVEAGQGKLGNIMYVPAYPGALYGNMSVAFGYNSKPTDPPAQIIANFSAYTGGYQVFPDLGYVAHYPIINSNPNGHTPINTPAIRYYQCFENDNLISVESRPDASFLFWRRNFPFPPAPTCTASAGVSAVGQPWVSGGASHQQYSLNIHNVGDRTITTLRVTFNLSGSLAISQSWNMNFVSGTTYTVNLPAGLASGQTDSSAGFITSGSGSISVAVAPADVTCN